MSSAEILSAAAASGANPKTQDPLPDIVTPMVFMVGSIVAIFCGKKFSYVEACKEGVRGGVFSTVCLIFVVGSVVQVTTLTGAKGLLVLGAMVFGSVAPALMYLAVGISLPLLGGVLTHLGAAVILGIPFTLAMVSSNQIAVVANHKGFIDTAAYWENVRWLQKSVGLMMEAMYSLFSAQGVTATRRSAGSVAREEITSKLS